MSSGDIFIVNRERERQTNRVVIVLCECYLYNKLIYVKMRPSCVIIWKNCKRRLRYEYRLLCAQLPFILLCAFIMTYLSTMVFRNLAFYRFVPRPRMRDLGFDTLPDLENDAFWAAIKDVPMTASMWIMGCTCIISVLFGQGHKTPYAVNMLRRVLAMLSIGHCLRFCTYISTSMPGTTERCLPGHLNEMHPPQPTTLKEVFFTRIALDPGNNCGDLMFSGHILGIVTPVMMVGKYGEKCLIETGLCSQRTFTFIMCIMWMLIIFQATLILMMRNHYTSDIVVSAYVTPLLWNYYCTVLQPNDLCLEQEDDDEAELESSTSTALLIDTDNLT